MFSPSTNWSQCGKLIEEYKVTVEWYEGFGEWSAYTDDASKNFYEATPQEAVCRAVIAMKEGET